MSAISVPATAASFLSLLLAATAVAAQQTVSAQADTGMSKVRIVRLSEVRGAVQVDRRTGQGYEAAINNLPIVEQNLVRTDFGIAEVEFEDNSTIRLAPDSLLAFPTLERRATGETVSEAQLLKGSVYASMVKEKNSGSELTLLFGPKDQREKLMLPPGSHIRLQADASGATLAVFGGTVHLSGSGGEMDVPAKRTVSLSLVAGSTPTVTKNIIPEGLDSWDKQSSDYHARVATMSAFGNTPYSYGLNDMQYYGSFMDAGGCGTMWRPYFASAAWDPYANGAWAYYPSAGYSWVSPYPWGWTPYHTGSWSFCPGTGWGWMPGGSWNGINNLPAVTGAGVGSGISKVTPRGPVHMPQPPVHGPGQPTLMQVNLKPLVTSEMGTNNSFVFRRDSAGMGVPREGLGNLRGFSNNAGRHGMVSTPVYVTVGPRAGMSGNLSARAGMNVAAPQIHRGYAPSPAGSMSRSMEGFSGQAMAASTSSAPAPAPSMGSVRMGGVSGGGGSTGGGAGGGHPH